MKIFEYSFKGGRKKHLANLKFSGCGCRIGIHKGVPVHESFNCIFYIDGVANWSDHFYADDFGDIEAITFCTGKDNFGKWLWMIVPTEVVVNKAITRNKAQFGTDHYKLT